MCLEGGEGGRQSSIRLRRPERSFRILTESIARPAAIDSRWTITSRGTSSATSAKFRDLGGLAPERLRQLRDRADGPAADPPARLLRIGVEDQRDVQPAVRELAVAEDGGPERAGADERRTAGLLPPEEGADGGDEAVDVVPDARPPGHAGERDVLAHDDPAELHAVGQLRRRHGLLAQPAHAQQPVQVERHAADRRRVEDLVGTGGHRSWEDGLDDTTPPTPRQGAESLGRNRPFVVASLPFPTIERP